jgi:hypothetical protein
MLFVPSNISQVVWHKVRGIGDHVAKKMKAPIPIMLVEIIVANEDVHPSSISRENRYRHFIVII